MLRNIVIFVGVALVALVAVEVGRTLMVPAYVPAKAEAAPQLGYDASKIAARLGEAVRFKTISWQEGAPEENVKASHEAMIAFRDWISTTYPQFSKAAKREVISDYSLLFTWEGADPSLKPILLMSHMDVVPVVAPLLGKEARVVAPLPVKEASAAAPKLAQLVKEASVVAPQLVKK